MGRNYWPSSRKNWKIKTRKKDFTRLFLSRIIKRRPVAKEVADKGRIKVNGVLAKSSTDLKVNDEVEVRFGNKLLTVKVLEMLDSTKKEDASKMYEIIRETRIEEDA